MGTLFPGEFAKYFSAPDLILHACLANTVNVLLFVVVATAFVVAFLATVKLKEIASGLARLARVFLQVVLT